MDMDIWDVILRYGFWVLLLYLVWGKHLVVSMLDSTITWQLLIPSISTSFFIPFSSWIGDGKEHKRDSGTSWTNAWEESLLIHILVSEQAATTCWTSAWTCEYKHNLTPCRCFTIGNDCVLSSLTYSLETKLRIKIVIEFHPALPHIIHCDKSIWKKHRIVMNVCTTQVKQPCSSKNFQWKVHQAYSMDLHATSSKAVTISADTLFSFIVSRTLLTFSCQHWPTHTSTIKQKCNSESLLKIDLSTAQTRWEGHL